jgi:uncharacterized Rossmann fold enzyme
VRRALLDECVPWRFQKELPGFSVTHVRDAGWAGQRNGALLRLMRDSGFTVLVTVDRNLAYQQNVAAAGVAVIVLHAHGNRLADLVPLAPALREALATAPVGQVTNVGA